MTSPVEVFSFINVQEGPLIILMVSLAYHLCLNDHTTKISCTKHVEMSLEKFRESYLKIRISFQLTITVCTHVLVVCYTNGEVHLTLDCLTCAIGAGNLDMVYHSTSLPHTCDIKLNVYIVSQSKISLTLV